MSEIKQPVIKQEANGRFLLPTRQPLNVGKGKWAQYFKTKHILTSWSGKADE